MDDATESAHPSRLSVVLAGLQAGMLGACWMLLWLGVSAVLQLRSFWAAENLMASAFYGDQAIRSGFAASTFCGVALYLTLYSVLGALFAMAIGDRWPRLRVMLVSLLFGLSWYYLSFRLIWKSVLPLVALLHSAQPMFVGHMIYGVVLGRYPAYLPKPPAAVVPAGDVVPEAGLPAETMAPAGESPDATASQKQEDLLNPGGLTD